MDYIGDFDVYSSPQDPRLINDPETTDFAAIHSRPLLGKRRTVETAPQVLFRPPTVIRNFVTHPTNSRVFAKRIPVGQTSMASCNQQSGQILILTLAQIHLVGSMNRWFGTLAAGTSHSLMVR